MTRNNPSQNLSPFNPYNNPIATPQLRQRRSLRNTPLETPLFETETETERVVGISAAETDVTEAVELPNNPTVIDMEAGPSYMLPQIEENIAIGRPPEDDRVVPIKNNPPCVEPNYLSNSFTHTYFFMSCTTCRSGPGGFLTALMHFLFLLGLLQVLFWLISVIHQRIQQIK